MRRLIAEEPICEAAIWSERLAALALAMSAVAIGMARFAGVGPQTALTVFGAALTIAALAALLAGSAAAIIWREGLRGSGRAAFGFALSLALIAYPAWLAVAAFRLPQLTDISTDAADPPGFMISTKARLARGGRTPPPYDAAKATTQREAYPQVAPLFVDLEAPQAYELSLRLAKAAGWRVVDSIPPNLRGDGVAHIDAIDRSLFFGFPSDVTVRITPLANQTRIDVRSLARFGKHDLGAGARRIARFLTLAQDYDQER